MMRVPIKILKITLKVIIYVRQGGYAAFCGIKKKRDKEMIYVGNAFSLQMLREFPMSIKIDEISQSQFQAIKYDATSVVGHLDTANILGVVFNRASIVLNKGDTLIVAQLQGGRLPEGTTSLPEGFTFKFLKIEIN